MDATSSELIHFVVVPVETVVACIYVLDNIVSSLPTDVLDTHQDHQDAQCLQTLIVNGRSLIGDIAPWPLVVQENSLKHRTVNELHGVASFCLERSPLFRSDIDELGEYLDLLPGFSTNGIKVIENGTIGDPWIVLLEQDERRRWMFAKGFSGKYQERTLDTESKDVLRQAESLSAVDESSTNPQKKRKIINSAKEMCTQMVSKGYGGKVKLQDIMDTALNMAKK
ncbi:unnamed protein product [Alternaria alternata]